MKKTHIRKVGLAAAGALVLGLAAGEAIAAGGGDEQRACLQMLEGWYGGEPTKLEGILHPNFIKQGAYVDPRSGEMMTPSMGRDEFIALVGAPREKMPENQWDLTAETVDLSDRLATVKVTSVHLVDVCQLAKIDGRWQIINVLWTLREQN